MAVAAQADTKTGQMRSPSVRPVRAKQKSMTRFVESCVQTTAGSAVAVEQHARHRPRGHKLIKLLQDKKNILITTHQQPDPDALASSYALQQLLKIRLKNSKLSFWIKGKIGGGYNTAFLRESGFRPDPWDDDALSEFDAIVLLDVQPQMKLSPLPEGVAPLVVIDHHRARGRRPTCSFCDIRTDVGASASLVFSYFMDLEVEISPQLAAVMLFAIETDLAGAAGQPGNLDNVALSSLTLLADTRMLYRMRHTPLPQGIYSAFAEGLANAMVYDSAMITHLDRMESGEVPAVIADFLLRYEEVQWVLVTAANGANLALSLRTSSDRSAADIMRRLVRQIGEGGGHRTKAGGNIPLQAFGEPEYDRVRAILRRRLLRSLHIAPIRGRRLLG